ncbi:MAG: hypothetical protein ACYCSO_01885 [Cuniculiplasma sp.]
MKNKEHPESIEFLRLVCNRIMLTADSMDDMSINFAMGRITYNYDICFK